MNGCFKSERDFHASYVFDRISGRAFDEFNSLVIQISLASRKVLSLYPGNT